MPTAATAPITAPAKPSRPAVLLELFTSEGCSSCPPADELLAQLAEGGTVEDTPVIALELHVDYWNYLGWRDPFSDAAYSARQGGYVGLLGVRGPYTPQLVVDGHIDVLGSSPSRARAAILNASEGSQPRATIQLTIAAAGDRLRIVASELPRKRTTLYVAVTESGLRTRVPRGENAGRTLQHGPIVRFLQAVTRGDSGSLQADVPLRLQPSWRRDALRVVGFAQDDASGHVLGASESRLATK